jgi:histidyl-tRNA synthetase
VTAPKIQAPRGTYDVLPEQAGGRADLETTARRILESAGYRRIETPAFEATELFARGVGESTDIVQKEMYTFDDGGGRSITLRPEGTAPVCRAYVEHGMHKLPQPVRLWYLSSFFRYERAQAGRYREFWQVGVEALGSDDPAVDAEAIVLLHALLQELRVRGTRLRLSSLGTPDTRAAYRERLQAHLRAHADELSEDVRSRIDLNPLRAFDSEHPGTRRVTATAPRLLDELAADDAEHFAAVRALPRRGRRALRDRPDAGPRAGLLHAHRLRAHLRRARGPERRGRRRPATTGWSSSSAARRRRASAGRGDRAHACSRRAAARGPQPSVGPATSPTRKPGAAKQAFARSS